MNVSRRLRLVTAAGLIAWQGGCAYVVLALRGLQAHDPRPRTERLAAWGPAEARQMALGFPAAIGHVNNFDDTAFTVMTPEGVVVVHVDPSTRTVTRQGEAHLRDLFPGVGLIVSGAADARGGVLADVLVVDPAP